MIFTYLRRNIFYENECATFLNSNPTFNIKHKKVFSIIQSDSLRLFMFYQEQLYSIWSI